MIIKSSNGYDEIEFSEQEGLRKADGSEYFCLTLRGQNLSAFSKVYAWEPINGGLSNFFEDLAKCWKGWSGEKRWSSMEGELSLVGISDSVGHIEIEVTLRNGWSVSNTIRADAGQLEKIASDVKTFFKDSAW